MRTRLLDADGRARVVDEGKSMNIITTLKDLENPAATITTIATATITLFNAADGDIINSRNAQDANNANNHRFSSGTLTIELDPADATIMDTGTVSEGETEEHVARVSYTWTDSSGNTRTGGEEYSFLVRRAKTVQ